MTEHDKIISELRLPKDIPFGSGTLQDALDQHDLWVAGKGGKRLIVPAGFDLTYVNLKRVDFTRARLTGARLIGANLTDANLSRANLTDADLTGANLTDADLTDADLTGAILTDADLRWAIGNMAEVRSTQIEKYHIVWWWDGECQRLAIGCQSHSVEAWKSFTNAEIRAMDGREALCWWEKWKKMTIEIVEMSPAVRWDEAKQEQEQ